MTHASGPSPVGLPDPHHTLTSTDWTALEHAYGPATDAPTRLVALWDRDQGVRTEALEYLYGTLHHQNTLYSATVATALYVAAVLADPRTIWSIDKKRGSFPGPMRAELLYWIASVASEVTDEAAKTSRQVGFPLADYPPALGILEIRPLLFTAAHDATHDSDRHVREAAIAACIPLLDDPQLLHHRRALAPSIREVLGTSDLWQHRERAIDALDAWGEDSSGLEGQRNPFEFCDTDLPPADSSPWEHTPSSDGYSEKPPF
ncbi:hypothetical protein ACFWDP_38005 [Streptomyces anthocyanicus]|uniref:hypothetical protein n=1 Tax=Streptomyces TaxID=1883 RepID=UPI003655D145